MPMTLPRCARCGEAVQPTDAALDPRSSRGTGQGVMHILCARLLAGNAAAARATDRQRLHDAAPDLLAACKEIIQAGMMGDAVFESIKRAVAKAEGR